MLLRISRPKRKQGNSKRRNIINSLNLYSLRMEINQNLELNIKQFISWSRVIKLQMIQLSLRSTHLLNKSRRYKGQVGHLRFSNSLLVVNWKWRWWVKQTHPQIINLAVIKWETWILKARNIQLKTASPIPRLIINKLKVLKKRTSEETVAPPKHQQEPTRTSKALPKPTTGNQIKLLRRT